MNNLTTAAAIVTEGEPRGYKVEKISYEPNVSGLSRREHFAAMAMAAILSNSSLTYQQTMRDIAYSAQNAVLNADALIAELNRTTP